MSREQLGGKLREAAREFAKLIDEPCPPGKTCEDLIEEFARKIHNGALEEAARVAEDAAQAEKQLFALETLGENTRTTHRYTAMMFAEMRDHLLALASPSGEGSGDDR